MIWIAQASALLGTLLLLMSLAGPKWGRGTTETASIGRDIVLVLDVSRSMRARDLEAPIARWESAVLACQNWLDKLAEQGSYRVAVIIFAARPYVLVPLTADLDFAAIKLAEIDGERMVELLRPNSDVQTSGTRIGAALTPHSQQLDEFTGLARDIVLLTDVDDPADDREWSQGITAARNAATPVHVVGIGDPSQATPLILHDLTDEAISTKLTERVAQEIALEGRGLYLAARMKLPDLDEFYRTQVAPIATRRIVQDRPGGYLDRSTYFAGAAAMCIACGTLLRRRSV